jgi:hypothetical protein
MVIIMLLQARLGDEHIPSGGDEAAKEGGALAFGLKE